MDKREEYNRKYDIQVKDGSSVFKQVDREQSLIHLMRVNLLKRMESSINSFALTLEKLLYEISNLIARIDAHEEESFEEISIEDIEIDSHEFEAVLIGKKVKVLINDIDAIRWKQDLEDDHEKLTFLLDEARSIDSTRDAKLNKLRTIIESKCNTPINPGNKKIIVFTAFADTAHYIYENIAEWAQEHLGIYSSVITGSRAVKTTMPGIKQNLSNLIISFSPRSKERDKIDSSITDEIDILIATDCLSEGQNLQDCDYLVNYDIHWNPVRIIQRFGRIDRLGSQNDCVQLLNFWPNMELDEYINLEARVSGRMILLDISATGEENIIEYDEKKKMNDLEYRRKQLQHLQENVVDIEEMSGGVSITDLTLNDFRMDLSQYIKEQSDVFETAPTGLYAVIYNDKTIPDEEIEPGVIFCLKNVSSKIKLEGSYAIAPYYLVYVTDNGVVKYNFMQTKKILDLLKKLGLGLHNPDDRAIELLSKSTNNIKDMSHYCSLLESAIYSVIGKTEEKGVESLFSRGGTVLSKDTFQGIEDFEVISYLILK